MCAFGEATPDEPSNTTLIAKNGALRTLDSSSVKRSDQDLVKTPAMSASTFQYKADLGLEQNTIASQQSTTVSTRSDIASETGSQKVERSASTLDGGAGSTGVIPIKTQVKPITIDIPLKHGQFYLGDVSVRISGENAVSVNSESLKAPLAKIMKPQALHAIFSDQDVAAKNPAEAGGVSEVSKTEQGEKGSLLLVRLFERKPETGPPGKAADAPAIDTPARQPNASASFAALADLQKRGLNLSYDGQASELKISPAIDQLLDRNLDFGSSSESVISANRQTPAGISAYVNTRMVAEYVHQSSSGETGIRAPNFDFEGAVRIGSVVVEGEASLTNDSRNSPMAGFQDQSYALTRKSTRLVYDYAPETVRIKVGDLSPGVAGFQASTDILGVSAERSYALLRPGQTIRPTAHQTFRVDRPSSLDISVDGVISRRFRLQPGNYNIRDLPIGPGATKVTLIFEDDTGARKTLDITNFSGADFLAPGIDEWQIAGGVKAAHAVQPSREKLFFSPVTLTQPEYLWDQPVVTASYRMGLTPSIMAGFNAQADQQTVMAGSTVSLQTAIGFVSLDLSTSLADQSSFGFAARSSYELANVRGSNGLNQSFRASAEYKSAAFAPINEGILRRDAILNFGAGYSRELTDTVSASVTASLSFGRDLFSSLDSWEADASVTKRFSNVLSGAFSVGYRSGAGTADTTHPCICVHDYDAAGLRALARISYRPDAASSVSLGYDTQTGTARATASTSGGGGIGAWNASVDTAYAANGQTADVNASANYSANRADVSVSHALRLDNFSRGTDTARTVDERTTLRTETGFAVADGAWSYGRPIRNSFAVIDTHESLGDRSVIIGNRDAPSVRSDGLAGALVTDLGPYSARRINYDVENSPPGYDLGTGTYDVQAPYKSGYKLQVGSAYAITAVGSLMDRDGNAVALLQGGAKEADKKDAVKVEIFTNKAGRFAAQGLAPGRWLIEMATEPDPTVYAIDVKPEPSGIFTTGLLRPRG